MRQEYILDRILDYAVDGDSIWLITTEFPEFFLKYNFKTKGFEYVVPFPDEVQRSKFPFRYLKKIDREIFFFPEELNEIYIWEIDTEEFQTLRFENGKNDFFNQKQFYPIESEKHVYFISTMTQTLIQIEKRSKKYKIIDISQKNQSEKQMAHRAYYKFIPCVYQGKVLVPMQNQILSYEEADGGIEFFWTGEVELEHPDDEFSDYFYGIVNFNDRVIIYTYCGKVFEKDGADLKEIEADGLEQVTKKDGYYRPVFLDASVFEQEIVFWANFSNYIYKMNVSEKELKKQELPEDIMITGSTIRVKDDISCIVTSWKTRDVFFFNIVNGQSERYQLGFNLYSDDFIRMLKRAQTSGSFSIDYLEGLFAVLSHETRMEERTEEQTAGARIHKNL